MESTLSAEQRGELHRQAVQQAEVNVENARINLLMAEAAREALLKDEIGEKLLAGRSGGN